VIPKPQPGGLDPQSIIDAFALRMMYSVARDQYNATDLDSFQALAFSVRDRLMERWFATQDRYYQADVKRVYYLSLEFLLGRLLMSNTLNLGASGAYRAAMMRLGFDLEDLTACEPDAGLGNGGLGRLAACFLDSASTLALPFYAYGIRYDFGIFRQKIVDGEQRESPDPWLRYGNPWEVPRPDVIFPVKFNGRTEYYTDGDGRGRWRWIDTDDVYAMAYDVAAPGFCNDTVNSLRLWAAKSSREFDLEKFNAGAYVEAVEDKTWSENISKVLYPSDAQYAGRELRLKQQYFFVSATIGDILRRFTKYPGRQWQDLPDKVAMQLNDTHPAIAIPELMRVLIDQHQLEWDVAWHLCERVFGYTNHTVLPEALETWPRELIGHVLPRHMQMIEEIDRRFRRAVLHVHPGDTERAKRMTVIDDETQCVRMANLAIIGSHSVNGVARLHSEILKSRIFQELHEFFPRRFNNKTNGITPRRWLLQANPELSILITEAVGDQWPRDLEALRGLEAFAEDAEFRQRWSDIRRMRKVRLAQWLHRVHAIDVDPDSLFDVQIKRIHEYKRQLLNVLHVLALFDRIVRGEGDGVQRTVIFAGKAAPSYAIAKRIIHLIHDTAALARANPRVAEQLNVVFVPNYDVSSAELLFPATDLSEQISTAGTEASGTGCMKAVLSGGVIIGTHDGANIEICEEVGEENIFIFGLRADEVTTLLNSGYSPEQYLDASANIRRVVDTIADGHFSGGDKEIFRPIVSKLLSNHDEYVHLADLSPYVETQVRVDETWLDRAQWNRKSLLNIARMGKFSSDRTIAEYARDIWGIKPAVIGSFAHAAVNLS